MGAPRLYNSIFRSSIALYEDTIQAFTNVGTWEDVKFTKERLITGNALAKSENNILVNEDGLYFVGTKIILTEDFEIGDNIQLSIMTTSGSKIVVGVPSTSSTGFSILNNNIFELKKGDTIRIRINSYSRPFKFGNVTSNYSNEVYAFKI